MNEIFNYPFVYGKFRCSWKLGPPISHQTGGIISYLSRAQMGATKHQWRIYSRIFWMTRCIFTISSEFPRPSLIKPVSKRRNRSSTRFSLSSWDLALERACENTKLHQLLTDSVSFFALASPWLGSEIILNLKNHLYVYFAHNINWSTLNILENISFYGHFFPFYR